MYPLQRVWLALLFVMGSSHVCAAGKETLRYVVDQRDGTRVEGALVVATWRAGGRHQSLACSRVESFISGPDGSFTTPESGNSEFVVMTAYKKGYEPGRSPRVAQRAADGNTHHWQVIRYRLNADNTRGQVDIVEPTIYNSQADAQLASREFLDAYVQRSSADRKQRLAILHDMRSAASCSGLTVSTTAARPFYLALYNEQVELADSPAEIANTTRHLHLASPQK